MKMNIEPMNYDGAKQISKWIYKEPYSIYSMDGSENCISELLNGTYFLVSDEENNIIGYYCFGESAQVPVENKFGVYNCKDIIDIGLGIKPNLCGQGIGLEFLSNGLNFANNKLSVKRIRLTVAAFNQRAIKVYKSAGFEKINSFVRISETEEVEFWVMLK
ncbi:Ribosomal protein S18 acetylase RimI [Clostridium cavendishii DSM 21758]|uniref:Ribosomal protein S18 acetylase RimI n=1 Tax=Clostridium cavendishii DSM 21758 TaxID=1121302 RepID=A0A1M6MG76_9CLOT|nr:GNAT family N-acetyltransferase [Clostridium cavendishii]SHJ82454.1 Ribosomal protein S18 acetylase RimI [Clostridium cavendishii DSM 21758]